MKQCPNGHEVGDNVKYCPTCGVEIISGNKFCTKCGNERKGAEKFCPKCGRPFDTQGTYNFDIDEKAESNKSLLLILSIIAIAIIGVGAWLYYGKADGKNTVSTINYESDSVQSINSTIEEVTSVDNSTESAVDCTEEPLDDADELTSNGSNSYDEDNYSNNSPRTFANEQYVTMYLANQTFRSSDGFTIRFDGDLRMYAEGDYAGVVSVLRYNSTAALLRYGGGQYTEGRFSVQIVGDKLQLTDPVDGTVYYQR